MNVKSTTPKPATSRISLGTMERKVAPKAKGPYPSCVPGGYCTPWEK